MTKETKNQVVIKIGTSLITGAKGLNRRKLQLLTQQVAFLKKNKTEPIIVTSGAIGQGMYELGFNERPKSLALQQATAAVGQSSLMEAYKKEFKKYNLHAAQILISQEDFEDEQRLKNLLRCLRTLQKYSTIPIVNENDVTAVHELEHDRIFSDNDMLSALLAAYIKAKLLILLTDVNGIYGKDGKIISELKVTEIPNVASIKKSKFGTGGIKTKIDAAFYAARNGVKVIITKLTDDTIIRILNGESVGTIVYD